jgi:hypothetical protein
LDSKSRYVKKRALADASAAAHTQRVTTCPNKK